LTVLARASSNLLLVLVLLVDLPLVKEGGPIFKHINSLGTNKNLDESQQNSRPEITVLARASSNLLLCPVVGWEWWLAMSMEVEESPLLEAATKQQLVNT
jgi:hypothetical protein